MKHLDDERLVDAAEGRLEAVAALHLEGCASCQAQVSELRAVLTRVVAVEDPEPSPLFWGHFRARVSDAIVPDPAPAGIRRSAGFRWLTAATSAATIALIVLTVVGRGPNVEPVQQDVAARSMAASYPETDDLDADEAWLLVRSVADDLDYEAAREAGVAPASGALERAALELSPSEQTALVKLLEEEMKRTDS